MAFDLETLKTDLTDLLNITKAKVGPWFEELKTAFHSIAETVHRQALADEAAAQNTVTGAVKTIETQLQEDATAAETAIKGGGKTTK